VSPANKKLQAPLTATLKEYYYNQQ